MKQVGSNDAAADATGDGDQASTGLFVASVAKAFRVLETFSTARSELSLTEVAQRTGIGRSATQRSLHTLAALGYLTQELQGRQYRLSSKLLKLAQSYSSIDALREQASPVLEAANATCEETINLTVLEGAEVVYVLRFPSKHVVSVNLTVGTRLPAFCTAPGRAILAFMQVGEADAILASSRLVKITETTEIRIDRLRKLLKDVRSSGFALSNQEAFVGDISLAAPVLDRDGRPMAAVNIAVPFPRWSVADAKTQLTPLVMATAAKISEIVKRSD
ncbi:IclR family transcriptional regulator C-terminal domain-containing protein [Methylobacterium sp. NEAU 140]|uniref:IclR family transcriptional regulator n=1 Tax=Methylobacterium sp. NEAU 140 TaxID=3064945 RepID=UPI00273350FF|nr:IclR family transcriptional regulator C-terminal domain-containing protein [Methylobacterium sp. NEAU 140]MDP4026586.1 IclR family transcriptional regulator C-terminal domain-containing protein [Methylobacterium sp. NEAU 140]